MKTILRAAAASMLALAPACTVVPAVQPGPGVPPTPYASQPMPYAAQPSPYAAAPPPGPVVVYRSNQPGVIGEVALRDEGNGSYAVNMNVGSRLGDGQAAGVGRRAADGSIVMTLATYPGGRPCTITITPTQVGAGVKVQEDMCSYYHGARVEFNGFYFREG